MTLRVASIGLLAALALGACGEAASAETPPGEPAAPTPPTAPRDASLPLYPESQMRLAPDDPRDAARLADVDTCGSCHPDALATWQSSAHARASFDNPWYRQAVDAIREDVGAEESRFCAGCHDPVLLVAGAMEAEIQPDDPRAHAGVTCMVCHGTREARPDGNGSYTLSTRAVPLPDPADPREIEAHVAALTPEPLRTASLCGSCHRGFLGTHMGNPHHLGGIDDLTPFRRSGYAGSTASRLDEPVEAATCQGCHMPLERVSGRDFAADARGRVHSHRVAGGQTAMAAGDPAQLAAVRARLRDAARIDVAAAARGERRFFPADGAPLRAGDAATLDVVVRNLGAGHRFPGGTLDAQDTWIALEVRDADGAVVFASGVDHARDEDDGAHRLEAVLVDEAGEPQRTHRVHRFRAKVFDHTLGPRDAAVVRYAFEVPQNVALPLSARARLMHRRHPGALHRAACASQRSERGRAFDAASEALGRRVLDACAPQPTTELAEATVWLGEGSDARAPTGGAASAPRWRRHFDHALGLISDVQERLDDARPVLDAALAAAPDDRARAQILAQRARLEGRQGRLEHALADVARAEALVGPRPALARLRGDAYAQVWRWPEAAEAYGVAAEGAPEDESRWVDLARALGSAGDEAGALRAANRGLLLAPRDESLLRSRYLALDDATREPARHAYLTHRAPDALDLLRRRCADADPFCAAERAPVHLHGGR